MDNKPPGYQEDIPWPSLADSPWPIYGANAQNSFRSKYAGPNDGQIEWMIIDSISFKTGAVIGKDSSIYFIANKLSNDSISTALFKLSLDSKLIWKYQLENLAYQETMTPLLTSDNSIIIHSKEGNKIISIGKDANQLWETDNIRTEQLGTTVSLGGDLLLLNKSELVSINNSGKINWSFSNLSFRHSSLSQSPDGKYLYVPGSIYETAFYCFNLETRKIEWSFGQKREYDAPLVSSDGKIFLVSDEGNGTFVYALNSNGEIVWKFTLDLPTDPSGYFLSMDYDGNLILGWDKLYSISYDGKLNWKISFIEGNIYAPITVDVNNNIFCSLTINDGSESKLEKISQSGSILWEVNLPARSGYHLPITQDGAIVFIGFRDNKMFKIK